MVVTLSINRSDSNLNRACVKNPDTALFRCSSAKVEKITNAYNPNEYYRSAEEFHVGMMLTDNDYAKSNPDDAEGSLFMVKQL